MRGPFFIFKNVVCTKQTAQAICVRIDDEERWVPQSLVHDDSECHAAGTEGTLVIPEWFAKKEGFAEHGEEYDE